MIDLVTREKFDLVIPCHDSSIAPLQQHRADLEPHGRFYLISDEAFGVLSDKLKTNELARSLGIHVPREVVLSRPCGARAGDIRIRLSGRAEAARVVQSRRPGVPARSA